jgi:2-polyprenyl-6-methoxyphenol hydroxylase-like FAD-dependent oxidoreductase
MTASKCGFLAVLALHPLLVLATHTLAGAEQVFDCCIIGSGPAGLATAYGLRKVLGESARIGIFERSSSFQRVGGQVGMLPTAFNALEALDPTLSENIKKDAFDRTILRLYNPQGHLDNEMKFTDGEGAMVIPWFDLQQSLVQSLPDKDDMVYMGHELKNLHEDEENDGLVCLEFKNGANCKSRLVIGADGNLSAVRSILFDGETPEYAGACIWRMFVNCPSEENIPDCLKRLGESNVWTGDGKVLALQRMEQRIYLSGQAGWPEDQLHVLDRKRYIGSEDGEDSGGTTRREDRRQRFLEAFSEFDPEIVEFIRDYCETTSLLEHPIYFRPVGRPWGEGRVSMVGDAAHMMPPNMAMGTPTAFEDAVQLAHSVSEHGLTPQALRHYEESRQPRVNRIAKEAIRKTGLYYQEKDEDANPFKANNPELRDYIMNFSQDLVPKACDNDSSKSKL